jgi:4-aminobutyrate aminotransferase-like enzyme/Ser/Thr protein kinase RdoA (MazF antagonist)
VSSQHDGGEQIELFDYFTKVEVPAPALSQQETQQLYRQHFGVEVEAIGLGSQQDQNFIIKDRASGEILGVLKLSNPVFSEAEIRMQDEAARLVAERVPQLRIPNVVVADSGPLEAWWESSEGRIHARVLEYLSGSNFMGSDYLAPRVVARMGEIAGLVSTALADYSHPASARTIQWDLRHAERVIELLAQSEPDADVRDITLRAAAAGNRVLARVGDRLRTQVGHFDITDDNILAPTRDDIPDAVLDFGDVIESWTVGEIATTVSSVLHHDGATVASVLPAIKAFHSVRPLDDDEIDALWALVTLRGAVLVLSGRQQDRLDEENDYAKSALDREFRVLEQALAVPPEVMAETIRAYLGLTPRTRAVWQQAPVVSLGGSIVELDAGTLSQLNDDGAWLDAQAIDRAAEQALSGGADVVLMPAWAPVLTGAPSRTPSSPEVIPTESTLWLAVETAFGADCEIESRAGELLVSRGSERIRFASSALRETTSTLPAGVALRASLVSDVVESVPARVTAELAEGWRAVVGDAHAALGLPSMACASDDDQHILDTRERVLAEVQEHYYERPPQIERGWREYLMDTNGRVYLDMVNNVASVGHAHPRVVEAATRQMHLLNTNSRFHYRAIADYAEMITDTLPDELDTVFFVNSGSEAVDLAIRLAMASTSRSDIVAMREAYHGWTYASDAVSTSVADNPNALSTRPDWVHTVAAANSYRGEYRGADAHRYAPEAVEVIDSLVSAHRPPAGFICETYFGNAGGVALPDGYLEQVYAAVRAVGGLAIADEVQVGFGRLGEWFWGFHQQGVVPDIVAVAKSIGGGHPLGAVITRREIADRYRTQGYFFSSTGGSPVSCAIGMAILNIIKDEKLQENALTVGSHLKSRLEKLGDKHPIVGRVHGSGLYLGLEFVRDRETLEPATEETEAICNRLLELGVIMQPTGDFQNVLKIKPPLCISRESVDYFADALDRVLTTGW